ncbi:MAG: FHA domain-containing protein [Gammaproteobacteria bacterium]|nr:FHA domain-containing protein [Gammaproteobacteria bacterium]
MKFLIRFISKTPAGGVEHHDKVVEAPAITIGRATDQILHLKDKRARLQHALIEDKGDGVHISTSALAGVTVNGRSQRKSRLAVGDVIEVGANILRIIEPPSDLDFALTFELITDARIEHLVPDLSAAASGIIELSKRRLSWYAVLVVLVLAFLIPAAGLLHPTIASVLRNSILPDDGLWLAGPVHSKHSSTSTECQNCHADLFKRVADRACLECHSADRHVGESAEAVLGEHRCASCHLEHNEPPSLVKRHQDLCAGCHADMPDGSTLDDASDFLDAHPRFKVSLLRPIILGSGETAWNVQHTMLAESRLSDRSNLKFDHAVHLDEGGVITPDGRRVVECAECHVPEPGGARMKPIAMDDNCSGCHALTFDADDPDREVPHGDPEGVVQVLIEYYSARLLGNDPDAGAQRLRRPGRALTRADRDKAAAEAKIRAMRIAEELFERRVCVNCHEVSESGNEQMPWRVEPVRLTESFFPHANFSHAAHDTEVTSCDGCHSASTSTSSHDVLIPGIETCRDCHGSGSARRNSSSQTASTCVMCHSFHFANKGQIP